MVKFNRDNTNEKVILAITTLNHQKNLASGQYNKEEVLDALNEVFKRKCYLCENKDVNSYNIEHLKPHKNDKELKFSFDNLFLSCSHCNNIKLDRYENILDCTKVDIDEMISFRKTGEFSWDERILIKSIIKTDEVEETVKLLNEIYHGTTPMKILESTNLKISLRKELAKFKDIINEYVESSGDDKEDSLLLLKKQLRNTSSFTAFKRWIVKDNKSNLTEVYHLLYDL